MRSTTVQVPGPASLRVLRWPGRETGFLLVHGLASNALLWQGVAKSLSEAGHAVAALDLRGHGESEAPAGGYDTVSAADDVACVIAALGWEPPVVVGQSWGANVVVELAATGPASVAGLALVDGGWIQLAETFPGWDAVVATLSPPDFTGRTMVEVLETIREAHPDWATWAIRATAANLRELPDGTVRARLDRTRHMSILRSMWDTSIRDRYPRITIPTLLVAAGPERGPKAAAVEAAAAALADSQVRWYADADHDVHAQRPTEIAHDLLALAARTEQVTT